MLLLLAAAAPPAFTQGRAVLRPGVATLDPRVPVDVARPPWRGVVRVQTELGTRCTGFLLAPASVVTAAHCLFSETSRHFVQPSSVHVLSGYTVGRYDGHARVTAFHVTPGYDPLDETRTAGADWAVLTLDAPLGTPDRLLPLADASAPAGTDITLGGYGQDREERLQADLHCRILATTTDGGGRPLLRHGCSATRGTSGAPLLARAPDGTWRIVGVNVAADQDGAGGIALPLSATK
ncbi:MAG: trypsin-like serine peptidase [Janthinobacterium lividum]